MNFDTYLLNFSKNFTKELINIIPTSGLNTSNLKKAIVYTIKVGGKRLRPLLVMETSKILGVKKDSAIRVASSVEFIHCYSLVHDDLPSMDNDDLRRGNLTCHKRFNEATAILVGDALQSIAFEILSDLKTHKDGNVRSKLVNELAKCAGYSGMVEGQMQDLEAEKKKLKIDEIKKLQDLKTGKLFNFSCTAATILSQQEEKYYSKFQKFSKNLGLAFQIKDDILDIEGDEKKMGKKVRKDISLGKETFISLKGIEDSKKYAELLIEEAIEIISIFGKNSDILIKICRMITKRSK